VVDDSDDLTPQYIEWLNKEKQNIVYVRNENITHGNQIINIGLEHCETPVVCYMGNSTFVEPDWLTVAFMLMEKEQDIGIVGFKLLYSTNIIEHAGMYWSPDMPHHMNFGVKEPSHRLTQVAEVPAVGWALVLLRKAAFPKPLDIQTFLGFRGYDDLDNCLEVTKRGWRIVYCGFGVAYHDAGATRYSNAENFARECEQNRQTFLNKWGGTEEAKRSSIIGF